MPTVSLAHSQTKGRSLERVYGLVGEALEKIGGFEAFVKPGQSVLIKPDQHAAQLAAAGSTTDPLLVAAIIRMAREAGAVSVSVGASSSGMLNAVQCMQATGIAALAEQEGAALIDLGSSEAADQFVELPDGLVLDHVSLPPALANSDVIIALPKARTDSLDVIAGSIELCLGSTNQEWLADQLSKEDAIDRLADLMTALRPDLWITDALICGEGDGPNANLPHWCGCILASPDPVAMDSAIALLLGHDPAKLQFAKAAEQRGLGYSSPIVFLGKPLESVAFKAWPSHDTFGHLPINVLIGKTADQTGIVRQIKNALEALVRDGSLSAALHATGTPTILIGDAVDPDFEAHLHEGPYIVVDDVARTEYQADPRLTFVSRRTLGDELIQELRHTLLPANRQTMASDISHPGTILAHLGGSPSSRVPFDLRPFAAALACVGMGLTLCLRKSGKWR